MNSTDADKLGGPSPLVPRPSPLIRLDQVSVQFGLQPVLRDITLDVQRAQTLAVIGESGCGKTVLLKLIIGLLQPTRGRVWFDGKDLGQMDDRELTRQRLRFGFLFQGAALFDSMTVFDNVAFGLRQQGRDQDGLIRDKVRQRLQEVGLPSEVEKGGIVGGHEKTCRPGAGPRGRPGGHALR
jgi:phospholipid/cholesterol/gamma-HCH transport system ATP-binding protein